MKNSKTLFQDFISRITISESTEEITSIAYLVFEHVLNLIYTDILSQKMIEVAPEKQNALEKIIDRLNNHEPVQYILNEAHFFGRRFFVNKHVLIPRPETEELVMLVINHCKSFASQKVKILDIGTGSGCIPVTLALELKNAEIFATDISEEALRIAQHNATQLHADVTFLQHDILTDPLSITSLDVVISNPPYITLREKDAMQSNVVNHEPHLALFVPDDDALVFYKAIATKACENLSNNGLLCVEINEQYGNEVKKFFETSGFDQVQIIKDLQGKNRIVTGIKLHHDLR